MISGDAISRKAAGSRSPCGYLFLNFGRYLCVVTNEGPGRNSSVPEWAQRTLPCVVMLSLCLVGPFRGPIDVQAPSFDGSP